MIIGQTHGKLQGFKNIKQEDDALDEMGYNGIYNTELALRHFGKDFQIETAEFAVKLMRYILKERYGE